MANVISKEVLSGLRCPVTLEPLELVGGKGGGSGDGGELISRPTGMRYPIRDGIPVLLPEAAGLPEGAASLADVIGRLSPALQARAKGFIGG